MDGCRKDVDHKRVVEPGVTSAPLTPLR
jgi:hypothetical protein